LFAHLLWIRNQRPVNFNSITFAQGLIQLFQFTEHTRFQVSRVDLRKTIEDTGLFDGLLQRRTRRHFQLDNQLFIGFRISHFNRNQVSVFHTPLPPV
jgi:hypothetical protein